MSIRWILSSWVLVGASLLFSQSAALGDDGDGDGVPDARDVCGNTPAGIMVDTFGRPLGDVDLDCDVDLTDFAIFEENMTGSLAPVGMVSIPAGSYSMGCHSETGEHCDDEELPVHDVYVDRLYMDVHEITNTEYCDYLNAALAQGLIDNPDQRGGVVYKAGDTEKYCETTSSSAGSHVVWDGAGFSAKAEKEQHPMVNVSWHGAAAYANWLSSERGRIQAYDLTSWQCDLSVNGFRLPTEAEWEYACRGGQSDPYHIFPWGNTLDGSKANYWDSGDPYEVGDFPWTTPVAYYDSSQIPSGSNMVNGYGLYDMAGNVLEWCNDWHDADYYAVSPVDNPSGPVDGVYRVLRGGSWLGVHGSMRCAFRGRAKPCDPSHSFGFRLVVRD